MRYPNDQKAKTRKSILDAAGRVFRRLGYHAGGVDAVMKEAGLTHGGFYAHFRNKEALLAETVIETMYDARGRQREWTSGQAGSGWLRAFLGGYLSLGHRQNSEQGCPVPALISELDRVGEGAKESFENGLRLWASDIASQLDGVPDEDREQAALGVIAASVGGLAVARAVADPALAERILAGARELVQQALAEPSQIARTLNDDDSNAEQA